MGAGWRETSYLLCLAFSLLVGLIGCLFTLFYIPDFFLFSSLLRFLSTLGCGSDFSPTIFRSRFFCRKKSRDRTPFCVYLAEGGYVTRQCTHLYYQ
jgi:hypothetical protein